MNRQTSTQPPNGCVFSREAFTKQLGIVAPALPKNDLIPILTNVWLTDGELSAYNEQIAISVKCAGSTLYAGVPGDKLIGLLAKSNAKEVSLSQTDVGALTVKAGAMRANLKTLDGDGAFQWPALPARSMTVTDELRAAIALCMTSVDPTSNRPESQGITFIHDSTGVTLCASDGKSLARATIKHPGHGTPLRVSIPELFCKQLLALSVGSLSELFLADDRVMLMTGADVRLFGRTLIIDKPLDFDMVVNRYAGSAGAPLGKPVTFANIVDRACIMANDQHPTSTVSVSNGQLVITTDGGSGSLVDRMSFAHPDARPLLVNPHVLARCRKAMFETMAVTTGAVVFRAPEALLLIATS